MLRWSLLLALSGCGRWDAPDHGEACLPKASARVDLDATAAFGIAVEDGFVLDVGGFREGVTIGSLRLPAKEGWTHARIRLDAELRVIDHVELDDAGPLVGSLAHAAGAVYHHTAQSLDASTIERLGAWTSATRPFVFPGEREPGYGVPQLVATADVVAHALTRDGMVEIELLDAATGSRSWAVPIGNDLRDLAIDPAGNPIAVTNRAVLRLARADGAITQVLDLGPPAIPGSNAFIAATHDGFYVMRTTDHGGFLAGYDLSWTERFRYDIPIFELQMRPLAGGDLLLVGYLVNAPSILGTAIEPSEAVDVRIRPDGSPVLVESRCYARMLDVDALDQVLVHDDFRETLSLVPR